MDDQELEKLIESAHFIDEQYKEECKEYLMQIPHGIDARFYSSSIPPDTYQGDIIDKFDIVYYELVDGQLELLRIGGIPCMLLSHTCDIDFENKTREKFISIAPVINFDEFAQAKIPAYSNEGWEDYLKSVKANLITDILYIPKKGPLNDSVVLLDRISSIDPRLIQARLNNSEANIILSLSQIGFYYFLIKLTNHFARYEDREEVRRN